MAEPDLAFLDIDPEDERFYRVLLRSGGAGPEQLVRHADLDEEAVQVLQQRAIGLGLAAMTDGLLRPASPAKAVQQLIDARLTRIRQELESKAAADAIVASLLAERDVATTSDAIAGADRPPMERLVGIEQVRAAIDELTFFSRSEGMTTWPSGVMRPEIIETSRPADARILRRGIRMRSLFGAAALDDPATMAYLRELVGKGAEVRVSRLDLERILIFDRAAALTPIDPSDSKRGALLTREPGLVTTLVSLFDRMWGQAQEIPAAADEEGPAAEGERPTELERRILESLCTADKDENGARDVGISVRTYRKYVATLMHRLDASNRFHAALLARERGWI
ncbi:helix-turn-helix transcriptional regulator [Streptomyces sp. AP-93]|uniref:helix-turn-helix transcriptional regulator n=1 Tax=Streptomyces sp. AP-93 TaxID=2929048 RepID=UPI001FAF8CE3|nr:helix-turn-helix transcriptional regulator [Streptomyces sp. AP-93]MCJ0871786.1 helix-turn-helix transcriptional regulator [Streptomyces sp. AP-93]